MTSNATKLLDTRRSPAFIVCNGLKFLITDRPSEQSIFTFIEELKNHEVKALVRVCEPSYSSNMFEKNGIEVIDLPFEDGTSPPQLIIDEWLKILKKYFSESMDNCVAIHCVTGLGRAPVLVTIALMELGLKFEESVELIRRLSRVGRNGFNNYFMSNVSQVMVWKTVISYLLEAGVIGNYANLT